MLFPHAFSVSRATESLKYGPNVDFFDLCSNHADSASDSRITTCDETTPVAIRWDSSDKRDFITLRLAPLQHSKQTGLSKCFLGISSRCPEQIKEQNKAWLAFFKLWKRTLGLCSWLTVWTMWWMRVCSVWEFLNSGICLIIKAPPSPLLTILPWVLQCWTRRQGWTLGSTSWRYSNTSKYLPFRLVATIISKNG